MTPMTVDVSPLSSLKPSILLTLVGESFAFCYTAECAVDLEEKVTHLLADLPGEEGKEEEEFCSESIRSRD